MEILHNKIYRKYEELLSYHKLAFYVDLAQEGWWVINAVAFACFIDQRKSFDKVQHDKLINVVIETSIDGKKIRLIAIPNCYQIIIARTNYINSVERVCIFSSL